MIITYCLNHSHSMNTPTKTRVAFQAMPKQGNTEKVYSKLGFQAVCLWPRAFFFFFANSGTVGWKKGLVEGGVFTGDKHSGEPLKCPTNWNLARSTSLPLYRVHFPLRWRFSIFLLFSFILAQEELVKQCFAQCKI